MATIPFGTSGNPLPNFSGLTTPGSANGSAEKTYSDFNGDWLGYLRYMADNGNQGAIDKLLQWMMNESSLDKAREWTAGREDTQYQRLFADMRAAGINPMAFASLGGNPISSSSSGASYSGAYTSSYELSDRKITQNWLKIALSAMFPIIGAIAAAAL